MQNDWVELRRSDTSLEISFLGTFTALNAHKIDPIIRSIDLLGIRSASVNLDKISTFDITGAWMIERFLRDLKAIGTEINLNSMNKSLEATLGQLRKYKLDGIQSSGEISPILLWLEDLGRVSHKISLNAYHMIEFLGKFVMTFLKSFTSHNKIRLVSVTAVLNRVGMNALPIVGMMSFLVGIVLVYQGAYQLEKFGAEIFTVDLLAVSFLREIGILLTAIIVAGRSGSAFAAQIGTMKLNQEIDALSTLGLDPIEVLVVPRVIALVIAMPLLAFFSDMVGLFGGAMMSFVALDIAYNQFIAQLSLAVGNWTFWVGIIKAPVFGFAIALIGCFEGMQVEGGSLSVGRKTTKSVVEAIFVVILLDAIFSIMFTVIGI